ncbi:hypothetical protein ABT56_11635 [Photobacterium aquae]|uniref:Metallopeptidase DUF4344 n=1 Tax=Photobacterium aquae TaxID=1195763 RepID=A0A0J1H0Z6_9GAMM|nr:hypothetical protein ABT56_11635 [Photobacterium aquae]
MSASSRCNTKYTAGLLLCAAISSSSAFASNYIADTTSDDASETMIIPIEREFLPAENESDKQIRKLLQHAPELEIIAQLNNDVIHFDQAVTIQFGSQDGPLYDPQLREIQVPYQFWSDAVKLFSTQYEKNEKQAIYKASMDSLLHTLLHEIGHAYIDIYNIPVLGREEDAADNFASVILLHHVENGDDIALHAAQLFALEDAQIEQFDNLDFIDEHSLDIQRYFYTLCLIYGSNPDKHKMLFKEIDQQYKVEKEDICQDEFERIHENWSLYLEQNQIDDEADSAKP